MDYGLNIQSTKVYGTGLINNYNQTFYGKHQNTDFLLSPKK